MYFSKQAYEFILEAQEVFRRQPERQYYLEKQEEAGNITFLLVLDDPFNTQGQAECMRTLSFYSGEWRLFSFSWDTFMGWGSNSREPEPDPEKIFVA